MLSRLFRRPRSTSSPAPRVPPGDRVYAIGDIHGRLDLLEQLLEAIARDDDGQGSRASIIFLGDLIDRGPHSAQVVERAMALAADGDRCRFLAGNHEEVFLNALSGDLKALAFFCRIGGRETILSYGVGEQEYRDADYPELLELLRARVPQAHIDFLTGFEDLIVLGDYAFVHAGVRPGQPLAAQVQSDLRWIRREFLACATGFEKMIVHGHTITDQVEIRPNRIGLDTGAYASGRLSAMGFEDDRRWIIEARDSGA